MQRDKVGSTSDPFGVGDVDRIERIAYLMEVTDWGQQRPHTGIVTEAPNLLQQVVDEMDADITYPGPKTHEIENVHMYYPTDPIGAGWTKESWEKCLGPPILEVTQTANPKENADDLIELMKKNAELGI